jgi:hypothetical protein
MDEMWRAGNAGRRGDPALGRLDSSKDNRYLFR